MDFTDILKLFLLVMPLVAQYLVPVALLVAILLTFGRMSRDGEVLAARACGLHLGVLARPVIVLSVCMTLIMYMCVEGFSPWAKLRVKDMLVSAVAPLSEGADWFERLYRKEPGLLKVILKPGE